MTQPLLPCLLAIAGTLGFTFCHAGNLSPDCSQSPDVIAAHYDKIVEDIKTHKGRNSSLSLWRNKQQVVISNPALNITELWEQTANQRVRLTRYFDEHQRGIEYQPDEIGKRDWSQTRQLISDDVFKTMTLQGTTGKSCDRYQTYTQKKDDSTIVLEWLPTQQLIKKLTIKTPKRNVSFQLTNLVDDKAAIEEKFHTLSDLQTTDYTDIGDNESDPFLSKMINLGFVEHGASGFYDSEGHAMGGHHSH
jgi:hypothetical protein